MNKADVDDEKQLGKFMHCIYYLSMENTKQREKRRKDIDSVLGSLALEGLEAIAKSSRVIRKLY